MRKLLSVLLIFCSLLQMSTAQEIRFFKYSHSVDANSDEVRNKYSKSSSKYFYITCVDGERFAEVHGSWNEARTYANRYTRYSAFSSKFVQMTNMTDLVTGEPYILSEKYELYDIDSGYEIYPRQFSKINMWGNSSKWSYSENFYALGDCCLIVKEKGKEQVWHYYYELDQNETEELVELSWKNDPYNFDNIKVATPSYGTTNSNVSSYSSSTASSREEIMYKQQYAKRVQMFNSTLSSLNVIENSAIYSIKATLRAHQKAMREIRMEAQQKGIYIEQAYEEYASF